MYLVLLLYALFASVFTISKTGMTYTQPLFFVGIRMLFAGVMMIGYQLLFDRNYCSIKKKEIPLLLLMAFFGIYLTNALEFWGLKYLTSSKTCFLYSLSPFFSALFCYLLYSETLSPKKWLGLLIGFAGFIPILLSRTAAEETVGSLLYFSWAELAIIGAAAASVYGWIAMGQLMRVRGMKPITANGYTMFLGGTLALGHSYLVEDWNPYPVTEWFPFLECTFLLILISNITCYNLYGSLLKRYTPTFMSFAGFTTPLFAALFGWFFLGESITLSFYLSGGIVFTGLMIFSQEDRVQDWGRA